MEHLIRLQLLLKHPVLRQLFTTIPRIKTGIQCTFITMQAVHGLPFQELRWKLPVRIGPNQPLLLQTVPLSKRYSTMVLELGTTTVGTTTP
ncbi:hypothetical protein D3C78_1319790 [compost metagenome]